MGETGRGVPYTRTTPQKFKGTQVRSILQIIAANRRGELSICVRTVVEGGGENHEIGEVPGENQIVTCKQDVKKNLG